jgi:phospholipase C
MTLRSDFRAQFRCGGVGMDFRRIRSTTSIDAASEAHWMKSSTCALGAVAAAWLAGCGVTLVPSSGVREPAGFVSRAGGIDKIAHVVIIIQENRSLDNLFQAFPGARTQSYGYDNYGKKIKLGQIPLQTSWDVDHSAKAFFEACNGAGSFPGTDCRMNGFDKESASCGRRHRSPCPIKYPAYAYVPPAETKLYFEMGEQYVLGDEMFASNFDQSSFVAHQYLIAAQADSAVNFPSTNEWGCEGGPGDNIPKVTQEREISYGHSERVCFDYETLGDELDAANVSWHFYTASTPNGNGALWSAYSAVKHIYYGADWKKNVISPQTKFFDDAKDDLPAVSWITPTCQNSDHASCKSNTGPDWVASLVNAIGESKYWSSTAIFVTWDDPGGWYDHVPPTMLDYDGLGFRVPLLVISPYAKKGYVSHVHYESASILRFVEDRDGLPSLSASDKRATSPAADCFDFNQPPRKFVPIQAKYGESYFLRQPLDPRPVDDE